MMRLIQEVLIWLFVVLYVISMIGILPISIYAFISDQKKKRLFTKDIQEKLENKIDIDVEIIRQIAKARGMKEVMATTSIRKLMAESRSSEENNLYLDLCKQMEEITPYADLPQDARSSILKLREIVKKNEPDYETQIIEPIVSNLSAYVELKQDYARSKKITWVVNFVSIISFVFGIWGFYISSQSPDIHEIKEVMHRVVGEYVLTPSQEKD